MKDSLDQLRAEIDRLDEQIIPLLNQRARCAAEIGRLKKAGGAPLYVPERERHVFNRLIARNQGPLAHLDVLRIYRAVMTAALTIELREGVVGGGASREALDYAAAYVAGGSGEPWLADSPAALATAFAARPDAVVLIAEPWREAVERLMGQGSLDIRWFGSWQLDLPDDAGPMQFHGYRGAGDHGLGRPAACFCLIDEPASGFSGPPSWARELPARAMQYVPAPTGSGTGMLHLAFDQGVADVTDRWASVLRANARTVWMMETGAL